MRFVMLGVRRTTLTLDDDLAWRAKHCALDLGLTLCQFVNRVLADALDVRLAERVQAIPFQVTTWSGRRQDDHTPEDFGALLAADDIDGLDR